MSDPEAPSAAPRRRDRGLRIALAVSVAANLLVAGLVVGVLLHGRPHEHDGLVRSVGFGPFNDALRPADRKALHDAFLKTVPDFQAERARMRADSVAVLAALRASPYDPARFDVAMRAMQAHVSRRFTLGRQLMETFIAGLSPADRLAFADRLEASLHQGPPRADVPSPAAAPPPTSSESGAGN